MSTVKGDEENTSAAQSVETEQAALDSLPRDEWLEQLKVGDEVAVESSLVYTLDRITTIERVTNKQVVVKGGTKFWREGGWKVGGDRWESLHIKPPTAKIRRAIQREEIIKQLGFVRWSYYSDELLGAVYAMVKDAENAQPTGTP